MIKYPVAGEPKDEWLTMVLIHVLMNGVRRENSTDSDMLVVEFDRNDHENATGFWVIVPSEKQESLVVWENMVFCIKEGFECSLNAFLHYDQCEHTKWYAKAARVLTAEGEIRDFIRNTVSSEQMVDEIEKRLKKGWTFHSIDS